MERMFVVICDECGHRGDGDGLYGKWSSDVREQAKSEGWRIANKDACPSCVNTNKGETAMREAWIVDYLPVEDKFWLVLGVAEDLEAGRQMVEEHASRRTGGFIANTELEWLDENKGQLLKMTNDNDFGVLCSYSIRPYKVFSSRGPK